MASKKVNQIVEKILNEKGKSFSNELRIKLENKPSPLFQLLYSSMLFSTRIKWEIAEDASRAITKKGWKTPKKMNQVAWKEKVKVLDEAKYTRYDESTATRLEEMSEKILEEYNGDLRNLREKAEHDPEKERKLLKQFKGIGDVGVDIFFREAQEVWDELYPFADKKVMKAAERAGLPQDAKKLAKLVPKEDFVRLLDGLVKLDLENGSVHG